MIDLHCHLAYGVDDGAQTPEQSLELAKTLSAAGVTHVACTSHLRRGKFWVNDQSVQDSIHQNLDQLLGNIGPIRHRGAEHYLDELLFETCQKNEVVCYGNTRWLLVELPYEIEPPNLMTTLYRIKNLGYKLLLAHLERYPYIYEYPEKVDALIAAGYKIQANLGSFAGAYGPEYRKAAEQLLRDEQIDVLAGDCHCAEDVKIFIQDGLKALRRITPEAMIQKLTIENPGNILGTR